MITFQNIEDKIGILAIGKILFEISPDDEGKPVIDVLVEDGDGKPLYSDCGFVSFSDAISNIEKYIKFPTATQR